jgi:predicted TIM-barrel fold metal-dependent hydrolase
MMKIDIYSHILPLKYQETLLQTLPSSSYWQANLRSRPAISDMGLRFKLMDRYENYVQVLTLSSPPIEAVVGPEKTVEFSIMANDGMAELIAKYPDRFVAGAACLPMNDMDAALQETDRAIQTLGFKGIQLYSSINDKPLDSPEFLPLYEKMSRYDLPIWIHPHRPETRADYKNEDRARYRAHIMFGWPYETTIAMLRLVYSGILERCPNLKFITHHCGAMIPFFESRIGPVIPGEEDMANEKTYEKLTKHPLEYFKMFYADTANIGLPALTCGVQFFGADHVLFGTDMPFGPELGEAYIRQGIDALEKMSIPAGEKTKLFEANARRLLHLR